MRKPLRPLRDPKTMLQEWAQARGLPTPAYREVERTGPHHDPEFRVAVALPDRPPAEGLGRSKRAAEQAAAAAMLDARRRRAGQREWLTARRRDALRLHRADRRAQCRQIDADQRAGRHQGRRSSSRKVQTTRALMRGIAIEGDAQLVFVDTPGIFAPRRRLDRAMVTTAWGGAHDADIVGAADRRAQGPRRGGRRDPRASSPRCGSRKVLILNKVDLVAKPALLALAQAANERAKFEATFMISALTGDGVADLKPGSPRACRRARGSIRPTRCPTRRCGSSRPRSRARSCSSGCTRNCPISPRSRPRAGRSCATARSASSRRSMSSAKASARSCSARAAQTIKAIGEAARKEIAEIAEAKVHLFLFVKVREGWGEDPERYRAMGLEFPKE